MGETNRPTWASDKRFKIEGKGWLNLGEGTNLVFFQSNGEIEDQNKFGSPRVLFTANNQHFGVTSKLLIQALGNHAPLKNKWKTIVKSGEGFKTRYVVRNPTIEEINKAKMDLGFTDSWKQ